MLGRERLHLRFRGFVEFAQRRPHGLALPEAAPGLLDAFLDGRHLLDVHACRVEELLVAHPGVLREVAERREVVQLRERVAVARAVRQHRRPHLAGVVLVVGLDELPEL